MTAIVRIVGCSATAAAAVGLITDASWSPAATAVALAAAFGPLRDALAQNRGTALGPPLIWAAASLAAALAAEWVAWGEAPDNGRPSSGLWIYLSTLAALAALASVLNARRPGGGAWAILMIMLVVVFLIPWLEGAWMVRQRDGWDRLRLVFPWNLFLALLIFAGTTNFLFTRHGPSALIALGGFVAAWSALCLTSLDVRLRGALFGWVPWTWAAAIHLAAILTRRSRPEESDLDRMWLWFRDRWGSAWALRIRDRFNATAAASSWPIRLDWNGARRANPSVSDLAEIPGEAAAVLAGLLRRFADPETLAAASRRSDRADLA
jgi:hypothetical protein